MHKVGTPGASVITTTVTNKSFFIADYPELPVDYLLTTSPITVSIISGFRTSPRLFQIVCSF
jgi:hypothetical protein